MSDFTEEAQNIITSNKDVNKIITKLHKSYDVNKKLLDVQIEQQTANLETLKKDSEISSVEKSRQQSYIAQNIDNLIQTSIKNDKTLTDILTILQRSIDKYVNNQKDNPNTISEEEKKQLLKNVAA